MCYDSGSQFISEMSASQYSELMNVSPDSFGRPTFLRGEPGVETLCDLFTGGEVILFYWLETTPHSHICRHSSFHITLSTQSLENRPPRMVTVTNITFSGQDIYLRSVVPQFGVTGERMGSSYFSGGPRIVETMTWEPPTETLYITPPL
jgi:hypothetical protein